MTEVELIKKDVDNQIKKIRDSSKNRINQAIDIILKEIERGN
jgi:hypothetical protein